MASSFIKDGIKIIQVEDKNEGNFEALKILNSVCDSRTALFLSGGSTPEELYRNIAEEKSLRIGSAALIDERYGERFHQKSNELMIKGTNLLSYLEKTNVKFYPILEDKELEETASDYDETLRYIFNYFPKTVGILGLGSDGHTAGIPSIPEIAQEISSDLSSFVRFYDDNGKYGKRVTMTFNALSRLETIIVLVFGEEKREALLKMFEPGPIEDIPARFYLKEEIAARTILLTDQEL